MHDMRATMKIVVIGGFGFVGRHVTGHLQARGHHAVPLSRRNGLDLADPAAAAATLGAHQPDAIVNCAAHVGSLHYVSEFAATVLDDNLRMILNLYRAVREACPGARILNPVSNCSYPGDADLQTEPAYWNGAVHDSVWSFANAKRMLLVTADCYRRQHGIRSVNVIVPNAYGPGDYTDPNRTHALNGLIIRMLRAQHARQPAFTIWGTGKPVREWIFVKDIARLFALVLDRADDTAEPVNLGQKRGHSIGDLAARIKALSGYEGDLVFDTSKPDGAPIKILDDARFRARFPDFTFTDLDDGIRETLAYYRQTLEF
jgi:GDP-L-fucose synthase